MSVREKIRNLTRKEAQLLADTHASYRAVASELGSYGQAHLVAKRFQELGIDLTRMKEKGFGRRGFSVDGSNIGRIEKMSAVELNEILADCKTWGQVYEKFSLTPRYAKRLKARIEAVGSVFKPTYLPRISNSNTRWTRDYIKEMQAAIFCRNSILDGPSLRAMVRQHNPFFQWFEYRCQLCGIGPEWNGKKLVLQLDHVNGDKTDHRFENLRYVCPNCHSQTETYGSKNRKKSSSAL